MNAQFKPKANVALVGEIEVRRELAAEGWITINANTESGNFPNVDLIAVRGEEARAVQVKTTNGEFGSHSHCLYLGRAEEWLKHKVRFFNRRAGPLQASVVVLVLAKRRGSRFVVLPVAVAEVIAQSAVERWHVVPKKDGAPRSAGFDARIPFDRLPRKPRDWDEPLQQILLAFENRWDVLEAPLEKLHQATKWGIGSLALDPSSNAAARNASMSDQLGD